MAWWLIHTQTGAGGNGGKKRGREDRWLCVFYKTNVEPKRLVILWQSTSVPLSTRLVKFSIPNQWGLQYSHVYSPTPLSRHHYCTMAVGSGFECTILHNIVMTNAGGKGKEPRPRLRADSHIYMYLHLHKNLYLQCTQQHPHTGHKHAVKHTTYVHMYTSRHLLIQQAALYTLCTRAVLVDEEIHSGTLDGKLFIWSKHPSFTF